MKYKNISGRIDYEYDDEKDTGELCLTIRDPEGKKISWCGQTLAELKEIMINYVDHHPEYGMRAIDKMIIDALCEKGNLN